MNIFCTKKSLAYLRTKGDKIGKNNKRICAEILWMGTEFFKETVIYA